MNFILGLFNIDFVRNRLETKLNPLKFGWNEGGLSIVTVVEEDQVMQYPVEFLNTIELPGVTPH